MALSELERKVLDEIKDWEEQLLNYEPNDFQMAFERYLDRSFSLLPKSLQNQFFSAVDTWLFHLNGMIQGSDLQMQAKERILTTAKVFQNDIRTISDLKNLDFGQLQYIADQQIARHRLYSLAQGMLAGTGGPLLLGMDIPAIIVINLRVIQLTAFAYGVELNTPIEIMTLLKIFYTATLPAHLQKQGWHALMEEMNVHQTAFFYEGKDEIVDIKWIQQPLLQLLKATVIAVFRKRVIQGIPLVSMAIGAGANYQLTKKVTSFAQNYYRLRYFKEKEEFFE